MFTLGGTTFTKRLSQKLNISFLEAESIKLSYSKNELEKNSARIVSEAMKQDSDVWLTGVLLTLSEFENVEVYPSRILLCGGGSELPEIKDILENGGLHKKLTFARKPQISFLKPKHVSRICDKTGFLDKEEDITPLALANMALEFDDKEKVISKILKKVVGLMQA
jgi:cell division protein FtsA